MPELRFQANGVEIQIGVLDKWILFERKPEESIANCTSRAMNKLIEEVMEIADSMDKKERNS